MNTRQNWLFGIVLCIWLFKHCSKRTQISTQRWL